MNVFRISIVVLYFGLLASSSLGNDPPGAPKIVGKWKSDIGKTMEFNQKYAKLEDRQIAGLKQLFGKMTVEFTDSTCIVQMPAMRIGKEDDATVLDASTETSAYTILAETDDAIATKTRFGAISDDRETLQIWHFEDDYMWTYVGDSRFGWLHVREYFKRLD